MALAVLLQKCYTHTQNAHTHNSVCVCAFVCVRFVCVCDIFEGVQRVPYHTQNEHTRTHTVCVCVCVCVCVRVCVCVCVCVCVP